MIVEIKKGMTKADMQKAMAQVQSGKKLNARQFVGTVKWSQNPVDYQKRLRDEW